MDIDFTEGHRAHRAHAQHVQCLHSVTNFTEESHVASSSPDDQYQPIGRVCTLTQIQKLHSWKYCSQRTWLSFPDSAPFLIMGGSLPGNVWVWVFSSHPSESGPTTCDRFTSDSLPCCFWASVRRVSPPQPQSFPQQQFASWDRNRAGTLASMFSALISLLWGKIAAGATPTDVKYTFHLNELGRAGSVQRHMQTGTFHSFWTFLGEVSLFALRDLWK